MANRERVPFLVVGGGIGALSLALSLSLQGGRVHLLEAASKLGEIGAGIQLAPNATRVLANLGLLDRVLERAVLPRRLVLMDALDGQRITAVDLGEQFRGHYGFPYLVLHRSDLHGALLDACRARDEITLEVRRRVVEVEDLESAVRVRCEDGSEYQADALVAADGLHSVVRSMVSDDKPIPSGFVAYRGAIPFTDAAIHAGVDDMTMWAGPDLHLVQYKLRGGDLYNQVGVFRSHRFGKDEDWGGPEELDEHFGRCCESVRRGAALLGRGMRWPMFDREPIDNWTLNRITLLGDAAHPMLQYIAQGGCQAIEDAACLGEMVARYDDPAQAFSAYQEVRIPRTATVQRTARRFGELCHIGGIGIALRNALLEQHQFDDYEPLDWLYKSEVGGSPCAGGESLNDDLGASQRKEQGSWP